MSNFTPVLMSILGRKKFGERTVRNLQTRIHLLKNSQDQVVSIIDQFHLSKCIPNVSVKFISCLKNL